MIERWKDIKGYEGYYQISDFGNVKSLHKNRVLILKPSEDKPGYGYLFVKLSIKDVTSSPKIHRLVASHFVDNLENNPQVNHIDGDRYNNHFSNLEWVTAKENIRHAWENGLRYSLNGKLNGMTLLTEAQVRMIKHPKNKGKTYSYWGSKFNVHRSTIGKILTGKNWAHI